MKKNMRRVFWDIILLAIGVAAMVAAAAGQADKKPVSLEVSNPALVEQYYIAVRSGNLDKVKAMVGATPGLLDVKRCPSCGGYTPLEEAAMANRKTVVEFLLSRGANVNGLDGGGGPLSCTMSEPNDRSDMADFLLQHGARINAASVSTGSTALMVAAGSSTAATVRLLLDRGASVNMATKTGWTALHAACSFGRPEIVELLLSRGASTSAVDNKKGTPLAIAEDYVRRLPNQTRYQRVVEILTGRAPKPADNKFSYVGRALVDDRKAELEFTIEGDEVVGKMKISAVKSANARLAGADLEFKGNLDGPWEDAKTTIQGTWSGVDHFEPDVPNDGEIGISLAKPGNLYAEEVYVKLSGRRGRYGWCFPACGRVYKSEIHRYDQGFGQNPLLGAGRERLASFAPGDAFKKWETAQKDLSAPYELSRNEEACLADVVIMAVGDKRALTMSGYLAEVNLTTGVSKPLPGKIVSLGDVSCYFEPAGVIRTSISNRAEVSVEAVAKGIGKVVLTRGAEVEAPDGKRDHFLAALVYVIEVREKEAPPSMPADIARVDVCGKAIRRGQRTPVAGARISLAIASGPNKGKSFGVENGPTNGQGKFGVTARNLATAEYEVLVQLLGTQGTANENDLWPVKRYVLKLTRDLSRDGLLDVGDIELDTVDNLVKSNEFANRPDQVVVPRVIKTVVQEPRKKS